MPDPVEVEPEIRYAVVYLAREARSGMEGHPIVTRAGDRFVIAEEPDGWVDGTGRRFTGEGRLPSDAKTWASPSDAERFVKKWTPHPWFAIPATVQVVPVRRLIKIVRETIGFEVAPDA